MSKKLQDLKWESVALEGFPASMGDNLLGFVGLEECTDYTLDKDKPRHKKKKLEKKRKNSKTIDKYAEKTTPNKKTKLSNGFTVEICNNSVTPSLSNEDTNSSVNNSGKTPRKQPKTIRKIGSNVTEVESELTPEDMLSWAEFKLPEEIVRALMELGYKQPTKIQQLTLPAAIHGRRDILGAAETGSGKTLAFGLPILTGIMKIKEKAQAKGLDVYDIPYKKSSSKKKTEPPKNVKPVKKKRVKKAKIEVKESSEDGYSSGDDKSDESIENDNDRVKERDDQFIEEFEVPIRKKEASTDEGNDSDDSADYLHVSEIFNGDDESGDDKDNEKSDENTESNENGDANGSGSGEETESQDELDGNEEGIGCVKVLDNIDVPGTERVRTGSPLYGLVLTPTRELAIQVSQHLKAAAKYTGIGIATVVGGMAAVKQERELRRAPALVVGTPGRVWEMVTRGIPHLQQLPAVRFLAIDETDRMIERGHFEELNLLLERLNSDEAARNSRQNFVFSATLTLVHDLPSHMRGKKVTKRGKIITRKVERMTPAQKVKRLVQLLGMSEPKVVDVTAENLGTAETLTECKIACAFEHKDAYLYYILKRHPGRTIVFCNAIGCVKRLTQLLTLLKRRPLPLHAGLPQRQRLRNLERFRDDPHGVLLATDVAARGLDVPGVDHVVHYQVPRTAENYVHRSGRTARAHQEGLTILMMEPQEAFRYAKLCITLNKKSDLPTFPVPPLALDSLKALVRAARELDALLLRRRRDAQARGWRERVARECDIIVDDEDAPANPVDPALEKAISLKKKQLDAMLARPVFPRGFSFRFPALDARAAGAADAADAAEGNALQVMKKAIESGELKREKRKSKNAPLLKLQKTLKKK